MKLKKESGIDHEFIKIYIGFMERVLNFTVSSDIVQLINLYAVTPKRIKWFDDKIRKSKDIQIVDGVTISLKSNNGCVSVLCGDGEPLDISRWTKYEMMFKINNMGYDFCIGYVFGQIQDFDFEDALGMRANKWNSVGISIDEEGFYLYDESRSREQLKCEADLEEVLAIMTQHELIWRVSWDLVENEMEISVMNQEKAVWVPMVHYAIKEKHRKVIPALSLWDEGDSITLLSE